MPIVDKLRERIRAKGGSAAGADTIESAIKVLNKLEAGESEQNAEPNN